MGKVITVAIEKGGVGKTTTVVNLAALFGMHGFKTLVVDMDPQANCTKSLSGGKNKSEFNGKGIFDMFRFFGASKTKEYITKTNTKNVDMIPSNEFSNQILNLLPIIKAQYSHPEYYYLGACIGQVVNDYDIIIIDTPPSKDYLVSSSLFCADYVLMPFCADSYSIDGMASTYAMIEKLNNDENAGIKILGVLMTKVEKRASSVNFLREQLQNSDFSEDLFKTEIRKSVAVSDSTILSVPVVVSDKNNNASKDYAELYEEIIAKLG